LPALDSPCSVRSLHPPPAGQAPGTRDGQGRPSASHAPMTPRRQAIFFLTEAALARFRRGSNPRGLNGRGGEEGAGFITASVGTLLQSSPPTQQPLRGSLRVLAKSDLIVAVHRISLSRTSASRCGRNRRVTRVASESTCATYFHMRHPGNTQPAKGGLLPSTRSQVQQVNTMRYFLGGGDAKHFLPSRWLSRGPDPGTSASLTK
jgi:hypothetical protein